MKKTRQKQWWIKQRDNPQLGTYWVACGQLSKAAARKKESPGYGYNTMHSFPTEEAYNARLAELRDSGERVHEDNLGPIWPLPAPTRN